MDLNMAYFIFAKTFYAQTMKETRKLPKLHQDYLAGSLRSQLRTLQNVLNSIEYSDRFDGEYFSESIRRVGQSVHRLRKACNGYFRPKN